MPRRTRGSLASSPRRCRCESPVANIDTTGTPDTARARVPRLFGTDGVRGTAGEYPLDAPAVRGLRAALVRAQRAGRAGAPLRFLVGRDTRESGEWIGAELAHGASGEGATVTSAGVVPTPAVAYLTRTIGYDAGVVISASHNPFEDNGIKVFSGKGEKFTETIEREVEAIIADAAWEARGGTPAAVPREDLVAAYLDHLRAVFPEAPQLGRFRLAIDCANGATAPVAPELFRSLGLDTVVVGNEPDGRNINLKCGSTHPELLARTVVDEGCRMGVAFDGDGDRAIFVDDRGQVVDGDAVLLMCGLELALKPLGIELVRTSVGDKYVMEEMLTRGLSLGGEQSGHIIFSEYLFTGDGLCTALNVLRTLALTGRSLASLAGDLTTFPQVLLNVRVREKADLKSVPEVAAAIAGV